MSASCDYTVHLICPYLSLFTCIIVFPPTQVRALGLIGYVLTSSFLIRENILAVITINIHASLSYVFTAMGLNIMPSMSLIYMIFGTVLLLNSGFFVLLLHLLYSIFLTRLGMKSSLRLPAWLDKAIWWESGSLLCSYFFAAPLENPNMHGLSISGRAYM
jgi:hypothetical protein